MLNLEELSDGDLAALSRALHEARFPDVESDPLVWSAPFVVNLYAAIIDEQRRRLELRGDGPGLDRLRAWLMWSDRPEKNVVIRRLREDPHLRRLVLSDGAPFLRQLLHPFVINEDEAVALIDAVERAVPE